MDDLALLEAVMDKAASIVANVSDDQWQLPTPCPDYDVKTLLGHMVGWAQLFAATGDGKKFDGDPASYQAGGDAAEDFRAAAERIVEGWRRGGFDRKVETIGGELPAPMVFNMTLMEYVTHGWDLATATGQPIPFSDQEAESTLERAQSTLPPQYRGVGQPFGDIVEAPEDAPSIARLAAFMGRDPVAAG